MSQIRVIPITRIDDVLALLAALQHAAEHRDPEATENEAAPAAARESRPDDAAPIRIGGIQALQAENAELAKNVKALERANAMLRNQLESMERVAQIRQKLLVAAQERAVTLCNELNGFAERLHAVEQGVLGARKAAAQQG